MTVLFQLLAGPSSGTAPTVQVAQFDGASIVSNLDTGCELSFSLPGRAPSAATMDELATDIWVYADGVLQHRFRVVSMNQSWDGDGGDTIDVAAVCYKRLLDFRTLVDPAPTFTAEPQDQIVWQLIENVQAATGGDYGITYTGGPSATTRDRTEYVAGDNLGQRLKQLTEVIDGPWYEISGDLELTVKDWDDFATNSGIPLVLGTTAATMTRQSGASSFANAALVTGAEGTTPVQEEDVDLGTDPRGRWDRTLNYPSVSVQTTLDEHADGFLQQSLNPPAKWDIAVDPQVFSTVAPFDIGEFVIIVPPVTTAAPIGAPGAVTGQIMSRSLGVSSDGLQSVSFSIIETGEVVAP